MKNLFSILSLLILSLVAGISAQAEDIVYDFSSAIPNGWTSSVTPNDFEARGAQFIASGTLTLKGVKDASKVVVLCSCNNATEGQNTISVSVAGKDWGTEQLKKETDVEKTFSGATASGDLVLSLTRGAKSIYIKTVTVTCGEGGQGGGGGEEGGEGEGGGTTTELDPNYTYAEPTVISTPGALGSNAPYQFIQNNIEVKCSTGGAYETDFRVNAGNSLTFTATKAIKGIAIDGFIKKDFSATASAGTITYSEAAEDVEANPVLIVKDVNAKTVTINCVKQLRCYHVAFYFDNNPDGSAIEGGGQGEGGGEGEGGGGETTPDLDPNYTYSEPTSVTSPGEQGSNIKYEFVKNNVKVTCTTGALYNNYFGCNAENSITFTATKPIKGISINGYVKKGFEAEATSGNISYASDSETEVEANPVLILTDVNAKSVTINCLKQMRCYEVSVYFENNPDGDIDDGGDDEGDYNYDYEPDEATTLNITFDEMEYADYSDYFEYAYTDLYFVSEDYEMELAVFSPSVSGTALAPGTYQITSDYAEGTVQASPGGDDMYDYPAYIAANFFEEDGEWYYENAYYIVSGTLTVAADPAGVKMTLNGKTYKGSTVNATFVGNPVNYNEEEGIATAKTDDSVPGIVKQIRSNQIIIRQGQRTLDLQGREM